MSLSDITVVIVAKNEEDNIRECLNSIPDAKRYILIDNGSTDNTVDIALEMGVKVTLAPHIENFSVLKSLAISRVETEWGFLIDADERVTPELKEEMEKELSRDGIRYTGYKIPRKNHYFGKFLRYGGHYPDYQLRLFKRGSVKMDGSAVHERIKITGKVGRLKSPLIHNTYSDITEYLEKQRTYIPLMVEEMEKGGIRKDFFTKSYYLYIRPGVRFIRRFIFKLGFLDGYEGFLAAYLDHLIQILSYYHYLRK